MQRSGSGDLAAVSGRSPAEVYAVGFAPVPDASGLGEGLVLRYDGATWTTAFTLRRSDTATLGQSHQFRGVWAAPAPAPDVFVVGEWGAIVRWNGAQWTVQRATSLSNKALFAVWGSSPTDVWAVGDAGQILHYDGSAWTPVASGTTYSLRAVWGAGPNDVYAVGWNDCDASVILHWNGAAWATIPSPAAVLSAVWGASAESFLTAGQVCEHGTGVVRRHVGGSWATEYVGDPERREGFFRGIWGASANDVFVVGSSGGWGAVFRGRR